MNAEMWLWLAAIVIFGIAEAATAALVSVWFIAGSVVALIAAGLNVSFPWQLVLFVAVSALTLLLTRPLVKKLTADRKVTPTNANRIIGQSVKVTETIDNINGTGSIYYDGLTWTARSKNGHTIGKGSLVTVESIEGVKVIVSQESKGE